MFQERAHVSTIGTMPVTHREEVAVLETHDVWIRYVCILVDFVRIVR